MDCASLLKYFQNNSVKTIDNEPYISVNNRQERAKYYNPIAFNENVLEFVRYKISNNSLLTEPKLIEQIRNGLNIIYLDGDWKWTKETSQSDYLTITSELMKQYIDAWEQVLIDNSFKSFLYFTFIPVETQLPKHKNDKGGFHHFFYLEKNISKDDRLRLYDEVKRRLIKSIIPQFQEYISEPDYDKLFDIAPLHSAQCLLPFAQKSKESRQYMLIDHSFDIDYNYSKFVLPYIYTNDEDREESVDTEPEMPIDDDDEHFKSFVSDIQDHKYDGNNVGQSGKLIAEFMTSLKYLSKNHIFWKIMADNDKRLNQVVLPFIRFMYINYFLEKGTDPETSEFCKILTNILIPLLELTIPAGETKSKRATFKSCYQHVKTWYNKYSGCKSSNEKALLSDDVKRFIKEYRCMSNSAKTNLDNEQIALLNKSKKAFYRFYNSWHNFVKDVIMDGFSDEIRPFICNESDPFDSRRGITFDDVMPHQTCLCDTSDVRAPSFYLRTLRTWTMMFLFVEYYDNDSIQEAIRGTLSVFVRRFIYCPDGTDKNAIIRIYNIQQTQSLRSYPYNQWITDKPFDSGSYALEWVKSLYVNTVKVNLSTTNKMCGLMLLLENLKRGCIPIKDNISGSCKPFANISRDMDICFRNIISAIALERNDPPQQLDVLTSMFFPCRNGLLEFFDDGRILFHDENYSRFMNAYTNVIWDPNYETNRVIDPKKKEAWEAINTMFEQIYPEESEKEYVMKLMSSTLHGCQKDQFVILYGTGGDGKTTISNALQAMLGNEGISNHIQLEENGHIVEIENPGGLATTMKTETILASAGMKTSHDAGGKVELNGKRYCTVQEPDQTLCQGKINCATIKEILSGTAISAREIYKKAEQFVPNVLLTMQTNVLLSYTEDTDAVRRRISVITHRSKFATEINKDRLHNLKYTFEAKPILSHNLSQNPLYWQAMFYALLPYAQEILREKNVPISNIPRPRAVLKTTKQSFIQSNGLIGWLNKNVVSAPGHVINFADLTKNVIDADNNARMRREEPIIENAKTGQKKQIVYQQIFNAYTGSVYMLKDDFFITTTDRWGNKKYFEKEINIECGDEYTDDEIRDKYFNEYAISNLNASRFGDKNDVWLLGYTLINKDDDDE